jgi:RNA polymerase sigma-70 factor (ECF subfamily)
VRVDDGSDADLVVRAAAGDRLAFGRLVERHRGLLTGLVTRLVRDPGLVDDVVQDAIVTALTGLDRLREPASFGSWLAGIGLNTGRRLLRRGNREWSLDELLGGTDAGEPVDRGPTPEALAEAAELAARVAAAVAALPPGQARAVGSFYLAGLSYAETAEHLGVPVGAVRTRLHKARSSLRTTLAELRPEEPMTTSSDRVRMTVTDVRRIPSPHGGAARHVVLLADDGGPATLQVWIGPHEAISLALALGDVPLPRPGSYRTVAALLATTAVRVVDVTITDLVDGVFIARIDVSTGNSVDARPSDALNLALALDVPIYAAPHVLGDRDNLSTGDEPAGEGHAALVEFALAEFAAARRVR